MDKAKDLICGDFPLAGALATAIDVLGAKKVEGSINDAE